MHILQVEGLTKYFGGLAAVSGVDLHVEEGEIIGLIGPNGAGKTTLFNLISGALPLGKGSIYFKNKLLNNLKPYQICKLGVGRTFQSVKIFPDLTVMQNVYLGSLFGRQGRCDAASAAKEAVRCIEFVGLTKHIEKRASKITLIDQKRLEVARALATGPELLLLDELMAGLNPTEVSEAMEDIAEISKSGVTIVMIEHVMKAVMNICDRIIVIHNGAKIADGVPRDIAVNKTVIEVYLGEC